MPVSRDPVGYLSATGEVYTSVFGRVRGIG
jgi:hypothetical protein